jgi:hypothetical protein
MFLTFQTVIRNPQKLATLLASQKISQETIDNRLTIINGNVKNPADVSRTILPSTSIIVSAIGISSVRKPGNWLPTMDEWSICQDATATILNVLQSRLPEHGISTDSIKTGTEKNKYLKPLLIVLSTTGISKFGRDIPLPMAPMYWMLSGQHKDKEAMEKLVTGAMELGDPPIKEYVIVRPSMLTNGACYNGAVRAQVEDGRLTDKAIGYYISRNDVAGYIFSEIIEKYEGVSSRKRIIAITY